MIYTFKITSNKVEINLPYPIENAKHLKIVSMRYKTGANNLSHMQVRVGGYAKNIYYDGVNMDTMTKMIYLIDSIDTLIEYAPLDNTPDVTLYEQEISKVTTIQLEILIDRAYQHVSNSYPVYLELHFY